MKKLFSSIALLCAIILLVVSGCSLPADNAPQETNPPAPLQTDTFSVEPAPQATQAPFESGLPTPAAGVDVDLAAMSSTMVFAEVYNMMTEPQNYMGKTVRMRGRYYNEYNVATQTYYHFVLIADASACCQQGIEFIWNGEHTYPDDYPADNEYVEVTGVFGSYEETVQTYYCLYADAVGPVS